MIRSLLLVTSGLLFLAACCSIDPTLAQRSANTLVYPTYSTEDLRPELSIASIPVPASSTSTAPASTAPSAPPKQTVVYVVDKESKVDKLPALPGSGDESSGGSISLTDLSILQRTMILTISKGIFKKGKDDKVISNEVYQPADRLVKLQVTITPTNFRFTGFTHTATDYSSVTLDTLTFTKTNSFSANLNPTFTGWLAGSGGIGPASTSSSLGENAAITLAPEQLNVNLSNGDLIIYREAERGTDLAGNTLIQATLNALSKPDGSNSDNQIEYAFVGTNAVIYKDGEPLEPKDASLDVSTLAHLSLQDLTAKIHYVYILRHVTDGQNTYAEYKQNVQLKSEECTIDKAVIVHASDIAVPLWGIYDTTSKEFIRITTELGFRELAFQDQVTPDAVAKWITRTRTSSIGKRKFGIIDEGRSTAEVLAFKPIDFSQGNTPTLIAKVISGFPVSASADISAPYCSPLQITKPEGTK